MEGFQKFVLITAIVILIIALVLIGMALSSSKNNVTWPPMVPQCPDFWAVDGSGNNATCINVKDLGTFEPSNQEKHQTMNFNTDTFTGSEGACNKYKWATSYNLSWDGITYGVTSPCQTTTTTTTSTSTST